MRSWWITLRVKDWGVHVALVWCGALVYSAVAGAALLPYLTHVSLVSLWSALVLAAGYLINNYCDREQDLVKKECDPRVQSRPGSVLIVGVACLVGAAILLVAGFSHPSVRAIGAIQIVGGVGYSVPRLRLKERGVLGLLAAAAMQRLPGFLMIILVFPDRPLAALVLSVWFLVLGLVFILEHQLEDLTNDKRAGVRTWAAAAGRPRVQRTRYALLRFYDGASIAAALAIVVETPTPAGLAAGLALLGLSALLRFLGRIRYVGNRNLPVRSELPSAPRKQRVIIQGGGLSGLMAAVKLADWGHQAEVRDCRPIEQTACRDAFSVHAVRFDPAFIANYLDCSLGDCFTLVERETLYLDGRARRTSSPHWVCKRGRGPGTLDGHLELLARQRGVTLTSSRDATPAAAIVATGLAAPVFEDLGLKHTGLSGFWATAAWSGDNILLTYLADYTHPNYGYVASMDGLIYALVFSRAGVDAEALGKFTQQLEKTEGLVFDTWHPMQGAVPRECHLFRSGRILAGTLGGMMDPFWYSGVAGALLSGGVAGLACIDPALARMEHRRFTRSFKSQLLLADAAARLPWRAALLPWAVNGLVEPAGSLGRWCRPPGDRGRLEAVQAPARELQDERCGAVG